MSKRRRTNACGSHETPIRESSPGTGSAYPTGESFEGLGHMTDGKENLWGTRERGERHRGDRSTLGAQRPGRGGCQARESTSQWAGSGLTTARNSVSSSERGRGRWDFTAREAEEEEEGETRDPGRGRLCKHRSRRRENEDQTADERKGRIFLPTPTRALPWERAAAGSAPEPQTPTRS